jgi:uncharacterized protein YegP (UPF0339 family)
MGDRLYKACGNDIEVYKDGNGDFRWRIKRAGRIVADSAEGYKRRTTCKRVLLNLIRQFAFGNFTIANVV